MLNDKVRKETAGRIYQCFEQKTQIPLLNQSYPDIEMVDAYHIQERVVASFMAALPILQHCYDLAASFAPWGRATFGDIRAEPGYSHMEMVSGAGHGSLYLGKVAPPA